MGLFLTYMVLNFFTSTRCEISPHTCNPTVSGVTADKNVDAHILHTKGGNKILATFWKHPFARFTFVYSHGNAADSGQMHDLFIELRAHLHVNIMSYDY
ncbi:hypothetical protein GLYMA_17G076051v4 [Glycine max]|nr:hypothetical protein GLYMA_17G076051v4 [Glycine max]KAH1117313.1 hypothetical protein GYH30_046566 [Glycine max]